MAETEPVSWSIPHDPVLWPPDDPAGRLSVVRAEMDRILVDTRKWLFNAQQTVKNLEILSAELERIEKSIGHHPWGTAAPFSVGWYAVSEGAELKGKDKVR